MDWSLALASNGIFPIILRDENGPSYQLVIPTTEIERARKVIELFMCENPYRHQSEFDDSNKRFFHVGGFLFALFWTLIYGVDVHFGKNLTETGLMDSQRVMTGEWWRILTAVHLHGSLDHLASNAVIGSLLGGLAIARFGSGITLLIGLFAGASGNLLGLFLYGEVHRGLGASGLVFGLLGLVSIHSLTSLFENDKSRKVFIASLASGVLMFVLTGLSPESDIIAHGGGFVAGGIAGALLSTTLRWRPDFLQNWNVPAFFIAVILVLGTWWLALMK